MTTETTIIANDTVYISADAMLELLDTILSELDKEYKEGQARGDNDEPVVRGIQEVEDVVKYVQDFRDMSTFVNGEIIPNV